MIISPYNFNRFGRMLNTGIIDHQPTWGRWTTRTLSGANSVSLFYIGGDDLYIKITEIFGYGHSLRCLAR